MKSKIISTISIVAAVMIIISCSKPEDNVPLGSSIDSLDLVSDAPDNVLVANESVNFTATGDDGVDYSTQATFYVNQNEISGSSYVFSDEGTFEVYATYDNVNSNTLDFNVIDGAGRAVLVDARNAFKNQTITFNMVNADGEDETALATFYVNDTAISGNTFSSIDEGNFNVFAEYMVAGETLETEAISFKVFTPKRKVVVEDYTGTWCGFCPRVAAAIEDVHDITDDIAVVAIHETANSFPDPMHFEDVQLFKDEFGIDGLPAARINRTTSWDVPYEASDITGMAGEDTNMAIAINSQLAGSELSVTVKLLTETGISSDQKMVVYLIENGIIYDQVNYYNDDDTSPYYMLGNPIPNFVHNEVLRLSLTNIFGDNVPATAAYGEYSKSFSITIPSEYNYSNLGIVVMLVNSDNSAINAQFADVNENKGYE